MSTKISWVTNPDGTPGETLNVTVGCTPIGEGCKFCYAKSLHDKRHKAYREGKLQNCPQYAKPFSEIQLMPERLKIPLRRKKPTTYFVNSMSDLFHVSVPASGIEKVFHIMRQCPQHTFLVLTKRIKLLRSFQEGTALNYLRDIPDNCYLGVSVSTQAEADRDIPILLQTPAAGRFVSYEPAIEYVDFTRISWMLNEGAFVIGSVLLSNATFTPCNANRQHKGIDWIIAGCESGSHRRPANLSWFRKLRDDCEYAGVPYYLKQAEIDGKLIHKPVLDGRQWLELPWEVTR